MNYDKYPDNWKDTIRPEILKRDKYKCQHCGLKHRQSYIFPQNSKPIAVTDAEAREAKRYGEKAWKVFLNVCHIDQNTQNNDFQNLVSLCPKCHLHMDKAYNQIKKIAKIKKN